MEVAEGRLVTRTHNVNSSEREGWGGDEALTAGEATVLRSSTEQGKKKKEREKQKREGRQLFQRPRREWEKWQKMRSAGEIKRRFQKKQR